MLTALVANNFDTENFENVFNKHLKNYRLVHIRFSKEGGSSEYLYALNFESNKNADKLMFELETKNGVKELNIVTAQHSVEY